MNDPLTGSLTRENSERKEKIPRFRAVFPDAEVEEFFSDNRRKKKIGGKYMRIVTSHPVFPDAL